MILSTRKWCWHWDWKPGYDKAANGKREDINDLANSSPETYIVILTRGEKSPTNCHLAQASAGTHVA